MESYFGITPTSGSLAHYGVKGMKWGVRRKRRMAEKAQQRRDKTAKLASNARITDFSTRRAERYERRLEKQKKSRYGQTNPQIIGETIKRDFGAIAVGTMVRGAAAITGKKWLETAGLVTTHALSTANEANAVYKLATNYRPRKQR